jgi:phosphatidate cytidylyltransferase
VGAPLILGVVLAVVWAHDATGNPLGTDLLMLLFGAGAAYEMARLLGRTGRAVHVPVAVLASAALSGVGLLARDDEALRHAIRATVPAAALVVLLLLHWTDTKPSAIDRIALTMVPVLYVGLLFTWLREVAVGEDGARRLGWIVLVSKASDIGGWLVGKPFGRHKLIPSVSPGKSWEGVAGGVALSLAAALLLPSLLALPEAAWGTLRLSLFGLAIAVASIAAGITQSGWKRRVGAKDSSALLPEMGGVLDMVDSLLLAAPLAAAWYALGL